MRWTLKSSPSSRNSRKSRHAASAAPAARHHARHAHDELRADVPGDGRGVRGGRGVDDHLGDAGAVAQVEEGESAEIALAVDTAAEGDGPADVFRPQVAAVMGSLGRHGRAY